MSANSFGAQEKPSVQIDIAICELVVFLNQFSDSFFDSAWMRLSDSEVDFLIVKLINHLKQNLDGRLLTEFLLEIRQDN